MDDEMEPGEFSDDDEPMPPFRSIADTYKKITYCMSLVMMYPNPRTERTRLCGVGLLLLFVLPAYVIWIFQVYLCIMTMDINNLMGQIALGLPVIFGQIKMVYINIVRAPLRRVLDEVERDCVSYDRLPRPYRRLARRSRRFQLRVETVWALLIIANVLVFPLYAAVKTAEHYFFRDGKRFLVHDMDVPVLREARFESPYFEVLFVYVTLVGSQLGLCFIGFDGLFFIFLFHACLKLQMIAYGIRKVFVEGLDQRSMEVRLGKLIQDHCQVFRFLKSVLQVYKLWLAMIYLVSYMQTCAIMVQLLNAKNDMDPRFMIFLISAILHLYIPCYLSTKLSTAAEDVGVAAYCSGWELPPARSGSELQRARCRLASQVGFIMARAQLPEHIHALTLQFNMQMFVNVMRFSYSIFTVLINK